MYVPPFCFSLFLQFVDYLVQYLGEEGDACQLKAAVFVSNPWNLDVGTACLHSSLLGKYLYSKVMGKNLTLIVAQ